MSHPEEGPADRGDGPGPGGSDTPPAKSARAWLPVAVTVVLAVLAVVALVTWLVGPGRSGRPPADASGPVVTGKAVDQVLLDGVTLTGMLDQPFEKTTRSPMYPGPDDIDIEPSPGDCVGVVNVAPQSAYQSAEMRGYARETWRDATLGGAGAYPFRSKVMFVDEAVVALPSEADARALFAAFAEQWKRCDGQPVNAETDTSDANSAPHLPGTEMHITDVRATDTAWRRPSSSTRAPRCPTLARSASGGTAWWRCSSRSPAPRTPPDRPIRRPAAATWCGR